MGSAPTWKAPRNVSIFSRVHLLVSNLKSVGTAFKVQDHSFTITCSPTTLPETNIARKNGWLEDYCFNCFLLGWRNWQVRTVRFMEGSFVGCSYNLDIFWDGWIQEISESKLRKIRFQNNFSQWSLVACWVISISDLPSKPPTHKVT